MVVPSLTVIVLPAVTPVTVVAVKPATVPTYLLLLVEALCRACWPRALGALDKLRQRGEAIVGGLQRLGGVADRVKERGQVGSAVAEDCEVK